MSEQLLPEQFKELEHFSDWILKTETERNKKRLSSHMEELQALYDAILPRLETIIGYLNPFDPAHMPDDARHLLYLVLSFAEVVPAIELFKQPSVIEGFDPKRFIAVPVRNMTPAEL